VCTYGDDNARVLLATAAAAAALRRAGAPPAAGVEAMALKSVLGNLRLSSARGFRPGRIDFPDLAAAGWRRYHASGAAYAHSASPQPHYQAQMWAVFFLAFAQTGWPPLREAARAGLEETMAVYEGAPARFVWTEYLSEEQARLRLPLAWLVRTDAAPNATHRRWLAAVAGINIGVLALLDAMRFAMDADPAPTLLALLVSVQILEEGAQTKNAG
jgi:hypothetical protein